MDGTYFHFYIGNEENEVVENDVKSVIPDFCFHIIIMLHKDSYCIINFIFEIKALFIDEFDKMSRFNKSTR